jgi:ATP-binding cassette subfamily C protein LapB
VLQAWWQRLRRISGDPGIEPDLADPTVKVVIAASIAINLLVLAVPLYINRIYTSVLPQKAGDSLAVITLLLAAVLVVDVLLKGLRAWVLSWLGASSEHRLRLGAIRSLLGSDIASVTAAPLQSRLAQLRSVAALRGIFEQQWLVRRIDLPFAAVYLFVLAILGRWLVLLPLLLAPVFIHYAHRSARAMSLAVDQKHHLDSSFNETLHASLLGAPTIKTLNLEGFLVRRLEPLQESLSQASYRQEATTARLQNFSALFAQLNQLLIVSFGGLMVMNQELSSGALAACTLLSGQVTMPLAKLFSADGQQSLQWQASHDYEALQSLPQEPNLLIGEMPPSSGLLETDSFCLDPGSSLVISGGAVEQSSELLLSMTALQGSFPAAAQFDGRPLESYQRSLLRRRLRLLVPDPGLSPGTLLDNLTVFRSDSLGPKAAQLAAQLGLSPWIQALPKGYDTPIGDNQDFPIARSLTFRVQVISALLDEPAVLLLDASQRDLPLVELQWFLTLPVEASKVLAVRQWSDALPRPDQHFSWQGNQLVEVRS